MHVIRFLFIGLYALSCFFVFALHAKTLDAPTRIGAEDLVENLEKPVVKPPSVERAIRHYLLSEMRGISHSKVARLAKHMMSLAKKHSFPPGLLLSIIRVESNFQPWAVSHQGALGLMQIMPETGEWLSRRLNVKWTGPAMLFDEEINMTFGVAYLSYLRQKYGGDLKKMLSAYNRGPAKVDEDVAGGRDLTLVYYHKIRQHLPRVAGAIRRGPSSVYVD